MARGEAGFSVIGLAMFMIVLGVIASALLFLNPGTREVTDKKTAIILEANVNAVIGHTGMHRRLPGAGDYPSLVRSQKDGYGNNTHYVYVESLTEPNAICAADPASVGLSLPGPGLTSVAFVIWSDGQNRKTGPAKPSGGVQSGETIDSANRAAKQDDIMKWVTLEELKAAAQCEGYVS